METEKSYVDVLIKKGVTGGMGFEVRVKLVRGDSKEEIKALGEQAKELAENLVK